MQTPTHSTAEKAARLIHDGKVHEITPGVIFSVEGDHGAYLVAIVPDSVDTMPAGHTGPVAPSQSCSCPAQGDSCSHLLAVWVTLARQEAAALGDPFAGIGAEDGR